MNHCTYAYTETLHGALDLDTQGEIVFCLTLNSQVFFIGLSADLDIDIANIVASAIHLDNPPMNEAVVFLRERLKHGNVHIEAEFLNSSVITDPWNGPEQVAEYVKIFKDDDHPVVNRDSSAEPVQVSTPKIRKVRSVTSGGTPKTPRVPRPNKGGGWGVNYDEYGKGLTVKTKSPIDGVFYVADHDKLVDKINESLLSKGKVPIGPTKKRYGASAGVRPGMFQPEA